MIYLTQNFTNNPAIPNTVPITQLTFDPVRDAEWSETIRSVADGDK